MTPVGSGPDSISVSVSEDAYQGDAQFTLSVDGTQIGDVQTTQALHSLGQDQVFNVLGTFGTGPHTLTVDFLNDAYGGTPATDRNLWVDRIVRGSNTIIPSAALYSAGSQDFALGALPPPTGPQTVGSGPDSLVLDVSGDAYNRDGQFYPLFTISIDGVQVGGTETATASHGSGDTQAFTVQGTFGSGAHIVTLDFLNDAYDGTAATDRNLYLDSATNGGLVSQTRTAIFSQGQYSVTVPAPATVIAGPAIIGPSSGYAVLDGTPGDDTIVAQGSSNTITGNGGNDTIVGSEGGSDTIAAGTLRDLLTTLADTISIAGSGNVVSAGDEAISLSGTASGTTAMLGDGNETVTLDGAGNKIVAGAGANTLSLTGGNATVLLSDYYAPHSYSDVVTFTGTGNVFRAGLNQGKYPASGNVTVSGGSGGGTFALGWGTGVLHTDGLGNVVSFGLGTFDISPGSGQDTVTASGFPGTPVGTIHLAGLGNTVQDLGGSVTVTGGDGNGTFNLNYLFNGTEQSSSVVTGGQGNVFNLQSVVASIDAGSGSDTVSLNGSIASLIFHGTGNMLFVHSDSRGFPGSSIPTASVSDLSSDLQAYVDNSSVTLTFAQLGMASVVHLLGGNGGYTTPNQAFAALAPDGAGGTILPLTNGSIDFAAGIQVGPGTFSIG